MKLKRSLVCLGFLSLFGCQPIDQTPAARADARAELRYPVSGTFDANVRMNTGTFRVPVFVDLDQVKCIKWSSDPCMHVFNALLQDGRAQGTAANGELVQIQIEDLG
ncbi:MAG: hypothetical protein U0136_10215 [Bdellovibrionota bacterium]